MYNPFEELYLAIQEELDKEAEDWKPPKALNFRASEAADCVHKIWHRLMCHQPAPGNARGEFIRKQGQRDHDEIQRLFLKYNIPMEGIKLSDDGKLVETAERVAEVACPMPDGEVENFTVSARADGMFETGEGKAVFEFKTLSGNMFYWLQKKFDGSEEAGMERIKSTHQSYLWQMQITMYIFGLDWAWLGPKNRSNALPGLWKDDKPFGVYVAKDPDLIASILKRFGAIWRYVQKKERPPDNMRSVDGSFDCTYCGFYHLCYGAEK